MRIVNAELLIPTAEEIRNIVQRAYDAGRTRGREEAKCELQGPEESADGAGFEAIEAEGVSVGRGPRFDDQSRVRERQDGRTGPGKASCNR
jgi:hypothetical protein